MSFYRCSAQIFCILACCCVHVVALAATAQNITISHQDNPHDLHIASWQAKSSDHKPSVILLSGPIDSWHSDTAWFATVAPILASTHNVIAIDRAGLVLAQENAPVGYEHFATDLHLALQQLNIQDATVIAFASSNIALQIYLNDNPKQQAISHALLIDPDALTPYAIERYSADAKPFKDNQSKYAEYIQAGNYTQRVKQKNQADKALLEDLVAQSGQLLKTDWRYITTLFEARLNIANQLNLFAEIARYDLDLQRAQNTTWPSNIATFIVDTDFEAAYIDNSDDPALKQDLNTWREAAKDYYQQLTSLNPNSRYLPVESRAHLFQVSAPLQVKDWLLELEAVRN